MDGVISTSIKTFLKDFDLLAALSKCMNFVKFKK